MFDFKGKKVLITGASSGLGAALAVALGKKGANLALVARRKEKLKEVVNKVKKVGGKTKVFPCDVSKYKDVLKTYQQIRKQFGEIDVAFLNAGVGSSQLVQNLRVKEVRQVMNTNFFGVIHWLGPLFQEMQLRNDGVIVVTSSLAAYRGLPSSASYAASKSALSAFIESAQIDLLATKIKLVLVMPYFMITEMTGLEEKRNPRIWVSAQEAAKIIIKGVEKGKQEIIFPWHFHLFMYLMKIIPLSWYRLFWKTLRRGG